MKNNLKMKALVLISSFFAMGATATAAQYECVEKTGSYVYARNLATGQGEHAWRYSEFDNPVLMCARFIGADVNTGIDPDNLYCKDLGSRVVLVDVRTGQGTLQWNRGEYDNPMHVCQSVIGGNTGGVDRNNYRCKKTPTGYCAQNLTTGQCTHQWKRGSNDFADPKRACLNWLRQQN